MNALRFLGDMQSVIEDIPTPVPGPGEVLIKVAISAICGSERSDYKKGCSYVSGHEFAGEVVDVNKCKIITKGSRVTINVIHGCGECLYCKTGRPQLCRTFKTCQGGHGEYAVVPEECCIPLPDFMPWDAGVLLGGDTFGVAFRTLNKIPNDYGRIVLVSGAGPIGLGVTALLKYYGYFVVVSEPGEWRREFVVKAAGADAVFDPAETDIAKSLEALTGNMGTDAVIECSGNAGAQKSALDIVKPGGIVVFCGENYGELSIVPSHTIIHREITLTGAFYFTSDDFHKLCLLYQRGFDPLRAVSHRFPLTEAPKAFEKFFSSRAGKILITR